MQEKPFPANPELLACEICLAEIPASVAQSLEGPDYIHHFCGLECYTKWQEATAQSQQATTTGSSP